MMRIKEEMREEMRKNKNEEIIWIKEKKRIRKYRKR